MNTHTTHLLSLIAMVFLLLPAYALATSYPAEVARTGQITCYEASGVAIACDDTGQDGDVQAGIVWPTPRFVDNGDDTVTDGLTGLVWAKDANLMVVRDPAFDADATAGDGRVTWQHALEYVAKLNSENYLDHNDWSLPNINELESLANLEVCFPALPTGHPFTNVQSGNYWSSTSSAGNTDSAWVVDMIDGSVFYDYKSSYSYYVWPVRSGPCGSFGSSAICLPKTGQTLCYRDNGTETDCAGTGQDGDVQAGIVWPSPRFVDNGDETVTDSLTGLAWTKNANRAVVKKTWQGALDYVKTVDTGGHSDWRLPNARELRSLADYSKYNPALPQDYPFTNVQSNYYWSSTSIAYLLEYAWAVDMGSGGVHPGDKPDDSNYVWPVRSGQGGLFDNSTTTTTVGSTTTAFRVYLNR